MPTIKNISGPFRFFCFSFDCNEPMHVHARRDRAACKFWMEPVALAANHGFAPQELTVIRDIILQNHERIVEAWHEHCGS